MQSLSRLPALLPRCSCPVSAAGFACGHTASPCGGSMQDRSVDRQINDVVGHAVLQLFNVTIKQRAVTMRQQLSPVTLRSEA